MDNQFSDDDINVISQKLNIPARILSSILVNPWSRFHLRFEKTKSGKERKYYCPDKEFKFVQELVYKKILEKIPVPDSMHGYVRRRSPLTNARCHTNKRNLAKFDIADFFPSIHYKRVEKLFLSLGFTPGECRVLTRLTTIDYCVPHGYVTSPKLACLILANLDKRINRILQGGIRGKHTFFSDDISISSNANISKLKKTIFRAINAEGFSVKEKKYALKGKGDRKKVTGYIISGTKINLPREFRDGLKAILNNCIMFGPTSQIPRYEKEFGELKLKKSIKLEKFKESLWGKIVYLKPVNKKCFQKFQQMFHQVPWSRNN